MHHYECNLCWQRLATKVALMTHRWLLHRIRG